MVRQWKSRTLHSVIGSYYWVYEMEKNGIIKKHRKISNSRDLHGFNDYDEQIYYVKTDKGWIREK